MFKNLTSVFSSTPTPTDPTETLTAHSVPITQDDCSTCPINGSDDESPYESYPRAFDVDWDSELLGSANPAPRNWIISTGKADWTHDHTTDEDELAFHLTNAIRGESGGGGGGGHGKGGKGGKGGKSGKGAPPPDQVVPGILSTDTTASTPSPSLFSSSLISQANDSEDQSILFFPEWTIIPSVANSKQGAEEVLNNQGEGTYTLPYRAVVLLCSHKKRDKRCHIAAPLLEKAIIQELDHHNITTDTTGNSLSPHHLSDTHPAFTSSTTTSERELQKRQIEGITDESGSGEVGVFKINHLGGHRYAGVMIILFPSGATLYYGRVTPQDIPLIVKETIVKGRIVPKFLRGGRDIIRVDGETVKSGNEGEVNGNGQEKKCVKGSLLGW